MGRMFKKTKSEARQATSKSDMLKKFGGKFKKAFSKNKQNVQPETTVLPTPSAKESEQPSVENGPDTAPILMSVGDELHPLESSLVHAGRGSEENLPVVRDFAPVTPSQDLAANESPEPSTPPLELISQDIRQVILLQESMENVPSTPQQSREPSNSVSSASSFTDSLSTDRHVVRRSISVLPTSPSPTTGASSDTLFNTPRHSETSSPSSLILIKFRQDSDEHRGSTEQYNRALIKHLKGEEKENEDTEWAALVEWIKVGHEAEMNSLKKDHTAKVEKLQQERSETLRRLELRNRELRATKREIKGLKNSIEETTKDQEEIKLVPNPQSADESDSASVDQVEGGVALSTENCAPIEEVQNLQETPSAGLQDADHGREYTKEDREDTKKPRKKTAKDTNACQSALKQQLLEVSAPDSSESEKGAQAVQPAAVGGLTSGSPQQAESNVRDDKRGRSSEVKELQDHNKGLKASLSFTRDMIAQLSSEAETATAEIKRLKGETRFAQLEVGYCHAANAGYRAAAEDDNPARTAHLDGLLKRKDEAFADLEERAAECSEALAEETKQRGVDTVYYEGRIQGLKKELTHRINISNALTEGKSILKEQNDYVYQMFKEKIYPKDVIEAISRDYDTIKKDNVLLINVINERKCYVLSAEKEVSDLKAAKIIDDHTAACALIQHRQTQQSLNGLTYTNHQLTAKCDFQDEIREEQKQEFESQLQHQASELQHILQHGADDWLLRRGQAQEAQIAHLNEEITKVNGIANQWRLRAIEQQDEFCPMNDFPDIGDWNAEETRWRLRHAERKAGELQRVGGEVGGKWLVDRKGAERVMEEFGLAV
ncbi:MAG: hypothetical protein ASARMPRED_004584 [Alectoria sarmentosa]|nr:MAG: hypothetical protein ASARMPRED_004584 [Alectoria sarmentosa]